MSPGGTVKRSLTVVQPARWARRAVQHRRNIVANEFTGIFEKDGDWYIGYCPEVPGANGQGKSLDECRESLCEAIKLILDDRREQGLVGVPPDAVKETVVVR